MDTKNQMNFVIVGEGSTKLKKDYQICDASKANHQGYKRENFDNLCKVDAFLVK